MTHAEALKALWANTNQYKRKAISSAVWSREVDRILELRFPGEPFRHYAPRDVPARLSPAIHTSR